MTPKEKAKELIAKFENNVTTEVMSGYTGMHVILIKQCALVAVREVIEAIKDTAAPVVLDWWKWVEFELEIENA